MDNASKAIIMAGGVMIAVLLISIGMYLYTSIRENASQSLEIQRQIQMLEFNSFFTNYPARIRGYDVWNICGKIEDLEYRYSKGDVVFTVALDGGETISLDKTKNNYYRHYFYWTEFIDDDFDYSYTFDNNSGLIQSVTLRWVRHNYS